MKALPISLVLVLSAGGAVAQPRPSTTALPCAQARSLVAAQGAVVLGTGGATYDRFVSAANFCARELVPRQAFAPTLDNPQCPVGFVCVQSDIHTD
jgi:hypothetical protein